MANEMRLIDANALNWGRCPADPVLAKAWIDETKTVDAVPVVRCKDCEHWIHIEDGMGDCKNARFHLDGHVDPTMKADDFCSCGERREGV